ncbi:MAG TPA: UDP-2,3-diacylglucosamine diphosphatase [Pirellulaceae bacterium]|nr:UDP-2,3-diacylglucosamine diphosphatase [Pirellulaceae bacterium]HMO93071.1 UDP-2,3-diacylglucosamine diphosphatase [Pirellulaceae bacterium]HMP69978.1 UDP-2,3-diacylglucosamine diphosphatase [Pirellulaceae bacterium]
MLQSLPIRSVFISDSHLGFRYSKAEELYGFLCACQPDFLYLVGDFLDGWRLKANWYWPETYTKIMERILQLAQDGTKVFYTPGNHDDFLRGNIPLIPPIEIADEFVHTMADGRQFYVTHGDLFDSVERNSKWLSGFGTSVYDLIMWSNKRSNSVLKRLQIREFNYAHGLKRLSKKTVSMISGYKTKLTQHAKNIDCVGVICGHNHFPKISKRKGIIYANSGDWVEHSSALVELIDGSLVLINRGQIIDRLDSNSIRRARKPRFLRRRKRRERSPSSV